jgi:hypothetical protein
MPQKYKSSALFNFHSDFSKVPASSEFFNEIYDPNEIRAEKEAILLGVLSDDFLFHIARQYIGEAEAEKEWVVQGLRKDIRFVPLSRTTYQLVVVQRSGLSAQSIAWEVIERLDKSLQAERMLRMQSVYDSISQQLNELSVDGQDGHVSTGIKALQTRLEVEISNLERLYTNDHPRLIRLRAQLRNLFQTRKASEGERLQRGQIENWVSLRGILSTRKALLQVALRMEEKGSISHIKIVKEPDLPLWPAEPKKNIFLISALFTSLVISATIAAIMSILGELRFLFPTLYEGWRSYLNSQQTTARESVPEKGKSDV